MQIAMWVFASMSNFPLPLAATRLQPRPAGFLLATRHRRHPCVAVDIREAAAAQQLGALEAVAVRHEDARLLLVGDPTVGGRGNRRVRRSNGIGG